MFSHPLSGSISTPQQRRPSDPTWSIRTPSRSLQTPRSGKKSNPHTTGLSRARASPYMTPERTRITLAPGKTCRMELLTPKEYLARRNAANTTSSPMTPTSSTNTPGRARPPGSKRTALLFPPNLLSPSPTLVSPPIQGTPRREPGGRPRDPTRPTVQLLWVMNKCRSDDGEKDSQWTLTDALLNGRNDERDRSGRWNTLDYAVAKVWPELRDWIMRNTPFPNDDETWFSSTMRIDDYEGYIYDPDLATKDSSLDRVGFHMTPSAYDAACKVIKGLARTDPDLQCLAYGEINPLFVIYACADSNVPLPKYFSRQLLWKHLDATLRAKCWRGLGSARANMQHYTGADADHVPSKIFRKGEEDPDGILQSLLKLSLTHPRWRSRFDPTSEPAPAVVEVDVPRPVHRLQITIKEYKWVAKAQMGTIWYEAGDLYGEDDIACFAVIDSLTRLLPSCQGGILEISTGNIRLLWGVGGPAPSGSGAWSVVQAVCKEYGVNLRGKWVEPEPRGPDPWARIDPTLINVPPRDREVVNSVVNGFVQRELDSKVACRRMVEHLFRVTT